jgi:hypothetical protein
VAIAPLRTTSWSCAFFEKKGLWSPSKRARAVSNVKGQLRRVGQPRAHIVNVHAALGPQREECSIVRGGGLVAIEARLGARRPVRQLGKIPIARYIIEKDCQSAGKRVRDRLGGFKLPGSGENQRAMRASANCPR